MLIFPNLFGTNLLQSIIALSSILLLNRFFIDVLYLIVIFIRTLFSLLSFQKFPPFLITSNNSLSVFLFIIISSLLIFASYFCVSLYFYLLFHRYLLIFPNRLYTILLPFTILLLYSPQLFLFKRQHIKNRTK